MEQKIVSAAKKLFIEKGYEETNMTDIAAEVGINRPTLHYYFRTKDIMFKAVFSSIVEEGLPNIFTVITAPTTFQEKIKTVIDTYIDNFIQHPDLPRFIAGEAQRDIDHLIDTFRTLHYDKYLIAIRDMLLSEMEKGNIKKVPIPVIYNTLFSQMSFPFLSKKMMISLFYNDEEEFLQFIAHLKEDIYNQMTSLLCY